MVDGDRGKRELLRIESLMPAGFGENQDERLASIDLRERVLAVRVDLQDSNGQPVEEGSAKIAEFPIRFTAGHLTAAVPLVDGELLIGSPGLRSQRFDLSRLPGQVTLER